MTTKAASRTLDETRSQPASYVGSEDWWGRQVWVEEGDTRTWLRHSDGAVIAFAWGRAGLGARELARSILHDAAGVTELSDTLYGAFAHEVIAALPEPEFILERETVTRWLAQQLPDYTSQPSGLCISGAFQIGRR